MQGDTVRVSATSSRSGSSPGNAASPHMSLLADSTRDRSTPDGSLETSQNLLPVSSQDASARLAPPRASSVIRRLDSILEQAAVETGRSSPLDTPPRKLLLMSKALQVVDRNTIKDRYLFLFSDILVIAKPLDEEPGRDGNKLPLDRPFSVKTIVELAKIQFEETPDDATSSVVGPDYSKHPSVKILVQEFAQDPDRALATFLEKTRLKNEPTIIANLLFRTVDIDKRKLGEFLGRRSSKNILKAFVDRFGFAGVRIDSALRSFLQSLRLPDEASLVEHLLIVFAGRWFDANAGIVAFDKEITARLVFAMIQLNDALHPDLEEGERTLLGGAFKVAYPNMSCDDFLQAFREWDRRNLVTDQMLEKIYRSIHSERLAQAPDLSTPPIYATVSPLAIPSRLITRSLSDTITISIPEPDAAFGIHLQGQDLLFDPPYLDFSRTRQQSFRVIGNALGAKTAVLIRTGANATRYAGIPFSKTFYVERAFMRNTFRVAFVNHAGVSRKYLYSVDGKEECATWTKVLTAQIAKCRASSEPILGEKGVMISGKVKRAAEAVALRVLRDSLIDPDVPVKTSPDEVTNQPSTSATAPAATAAASPATGNTSTSGFPFSIANRLMMGGPITDTSGKSAQALGSSSGPTRGLAKTGHDVVIACQQNSLIPVVLSFLNVVKPI